MKLKEGLVLRKLGSKYIVVATGKISKDFKKMIKLNETGSEIFNCLKEETTSEEIFNKLKQEYEVSDEILKRDIDKFINSFKENGLINE